MDKNYDEFYLYYVRVVQWVRALFPDYRPEMKLVNWGALYDKYHDGFYISLALEEKVSRLMQDGDVRNKVGIYEYLFDKNKKHLNLRRNCNKDL